MITSQTYTARAWGQEDRTAGSMPGASPAQASDSPSFSDMVDGADKAKDTSETAETGKVAEKPHKKHGFLAFLAAIIDVINPLQHIPVISTIYRHITGDEISPAARIAGDALYGGPIGAAVGIANVAIEKKTGKDIGENMMAMVTGKHHRKDKAEEPQVANANGQRLMDIAWNDAATKTLPPIDIPVNDGASRDTPDTPHAKTPAAQPDDAGGEMPHIIVPAPRGDDMVAADPAPDSSGSAAVANDDDGSRNALLAFARDMRGGAAQSIDVTDQIKQDFRSSPGPAPTKLSYRTGTSGDEPLAYSYKEGSVQATKSGPATATGKMPAQGMVNVKTALHPQEVPADAGKNRAVPPELIAQRMMAGLDQYAAMQRLSPAAGTP